MSRSYKFLIFIIYFICVYFLIVSGIIRIYNLDILDTFIFSLIILKVILVFITIFICFREMF